MYYTQNGDWGTWRGSLGKVFQSRWFNLCIDLIFKENPNPNREI
jgi:hypothetical protein